MTDTYREVGYESGSVPGGLRPAVLVVDFQRAFTDPAFRLGGLPRIHAARDRTAQLLALARAHRVPVAACYTAYGSVADMPLWKVKPVREEFFHGHPCTEMDPKIHHPHDFTYCKNAPSMFFQTPLVTFLVKQQVDTVIVTGCTTSGCVRATIVDAFSYGFRVLVAEECCGDAEAGPHRDALRDVARRYADVVSSARVEDYLAGSPGRP